MKIVPVSMIQNNFVRKVIVVVSAPIALLLHFICKPFTLWYEEDTKDLLRGIKCAWKGTINAKH